MNRRQLWIILASMSFIEKTSGVACVFLLTIFTSWMLKALQKETFALDFTNIKFCLNNLETGKEYYLCQMAFPLHDAHCTLKDEFMLYKSINADSNQKFCLHRKKICCM